MSKQLASLLLSLSVESGEVEAPYVESPSIIVEPDAFDDHSAVLDAQLQEAGQGLALIESLEALADRYSAFPITQESMENYAFSVHQVLRVSGIDIPVGMVAASFEDADKSKDTIGAKVKGVVMAIIKWIQERLAAIAAAGKKLLNLVGIRTKEAEQKTTEVLTALGHEKFTAPADKGSAPASAKVKPCPGWMVKDGHLDVAGIRAKLEQFKTHEVTGLLKADLVPWGELKTFLASNGYGKALNKIKGSPNMKKATDYTASTSDVSSLIKEAMDVVKHVDVAMSDLATLDQQFKTQYEKDLNKPGIDEAKAKQIKEDFALSTADAIEAMKFAKGVYAKAFAIHKDLCSVLATE